MGLGRLLGRRPGVDPVGSAALASLLARPMLEVLPFKGVRSQILSLSPGTQISVTASPAKGLDATVELAAELQAAGFAAVPHVAARMVRDRAHLADLLARMHSAGLSRAFVGGGDAAKPGEFPDGLSLLKAIAEIGPVPPAIGIPCYPDGHAFIPDDALLAALRAKLPFASWMTTQLCFDAAKIAAWLAARRAEGIQMPAVIGVPGVTEPHRLLAISAAIGVRDTRRFVSRNVGLMARLLRSGGFYRPDRLLADLAQLAANPAMLVAGVHLYTFNQVASTESWRRHYLAGLTTQAPSAV